MKIEKLLVGSLRTNCYIISKDNDAIVVDPGANFEYIKEHLKGLNVKGVLVTHHHFDHIGALVEIESEYNIKENPDKIEGFDYEMIKTPGHTSDLISFYFPKEKVLFSGDFLFYHTIGRTDLPTSSDEDMKNSLKLIEKYPDDIVVYPGHGKPTVLGDEKRRFSMYY